jgi:hypothetical protein
LIGCGNGLVEAAELGVADALARGDPDPTCADPPHASIVNAVVKRIAPRRISPETLKPAHH